MIDENLSPLLCDIYAGAHDDAVWKRAMVAIGDRLNAQFLMVATSDRKRQAADGMGFYHVRHDIFDDAIEAYVAETYRIDPTIRHIADHPKGGMFESLKVIGADDYRNHPYVRWNIATGGSMFWTTLHRVCVGDVSFGMSVHRSPMAGPLSDPDTARFSMLFDHICNAVTLAARSPLMLDTEEPTVLLNSSGYVVHANDAARNLLEKHEAIMLCDGRLRASGSACAVRLDKAIGTVLVPGGSQAGIALNHGNGRLLCDIRAFPARTGVFRPIGATAVVRLIDPGVAPTLRVETWRLLFGLTSAEVRLAATLMSIDGGVREAAARLGIAYGTARVQLATLFDKVGVNSQAQLLRLLTRIR